MADNLRVLWEGCDGSIWDLLDPLSPVYASKISGLGMPGFTQQWAESGARDGKRYEGTTYGSNDVELVVRVGDDYIPAGYLGRRRGDAWRALDAAFRRSLSPEVPGRLVAISGAGRRQLELRLDDTMPPPPDINPGLIGRALYTLQLTAGDEPWWTGDEVRKTFRWKALGSPFFSGPAGYVPLTISPDAETDQAAIGNPGDRPAFPRWLAVGPADSVTIGVNDQLAPLPFPLDEDEVVAVNSEDQTIVNVDGTSLWPLMGYTDPTFAPVPPGEEVHLTVRIAGGAAGALVDIALTPRYQGPW